MPKACPEKVVRHGDGCKPGGLSLQQLRQPGIGALGVVGDLPHARRHADDDNLAQVPIPHSLPGKALQHAMSREGW
jgi:aminoglycoside phosphotransferase